jgi:hypothetical protein
LQLIFQIEISIYQLGKHHKLDYSNKFRSEIIADLIITEKLDISQLFNIDKIINTRSNSIFLLNQIMKEESSTIKIKIHKIGIKNAWSSHFPKLVISVRSNDFIFSYHIIYKFR